MNLGFNIHSLLEELDDSQDFPVSKAIRSQLNVSCMEIGRSINLARLSIWEEVWEFKFGRDSRPLFKRIFKNGIR